MDHLLDVEPRLKKIGDYLILIIVVQIENYTEMIFLNHFKIKSRKSQKKM